MNIEVILAFSVLLVGALTYAALRKPSKIQDVVSWDFKSTESAQIIFKKFDLQSIPKNEYRFCLLAETEEINEIEGIVSCHESINEAVSASGHTVLTARIDFKNKIQWQFYSARPLLAEKLIKNLILPVSLRVGKIEDPSWSEYIFHSSKT